MKLLVIIILISISLSSFSQKIAVNEIDKFTKQRTIETAKDALAVGLSSAIYVKLRSVDTTCFIIVNGYGKGADLIGLGDKLILLFDNDVTISAYSTGIQDYKLENSSFTTQKVFTHQYRVDAKDLSTVSNLGLKSIRKYSTQNYVDIDIPGRNKDKFSKLTKLFLSSL